MTQKAKDRTLKWIDLSLPGRQGVDPDQVKAGETEANRGGAKSKINIAKLIPINDTINFS